MGQRERRSQAQHLSVADFFSSNDARRDQWSRLAACSDAGARAAATPTSWSRDIGAVLTELEPLEQY
jgi:hypothetical protein